MGTQLSTIVPSTIFGEINDVEAIMMSACSACGIADYLTSRQSLEYLWERGFIECRSSYLGYDGRHYTYQATDSGKIAFSRNKLNVISE
jgi:hypothetical protein